MGACIVIWGSYLVYQLQRNPPTDREQRGRASLEWYQEMEAERARAKEDFWRDFHPEALDMIKNLEKAMEALKNVTAITPEQLDGLLEEKPDAVILDIRSPEEFAAGHIPGAKNREFGGADFKESLQEIDKAVPWIVYDDSGGYEAGVFKSIVESGAFDLHRLEGGFQAWRTAESPR